MKRFIAILLVLVLALSLVACGGNDNDLVGTWEHETTAFTIEWTFRADGTGEVVFIGHFNDAEHVDAFTWSTGNNDTIELDFEDFEEIETFTFTIDGDTLTMADEYDGEERIYTRVS